MSNIAPTYHDMRTKLILLLLQKKSASESIGILLDARGEQTLGHAQCNEQFNKFKSGVCDVKN